MDTDASIELSALLNPVAQVLHRPSSSAQLFSETPPCVITQWVESRAAPPELHLSPWWWFILMGYKCRNSPTQNCCIYRILQEHSWNPEGKAWMNEWTQVPFGLWWRTYLLLQGKFHWEKLRMSSPQGEIKKLHDSTPLRPYSSLEQRLGWIPIKYSGLTKKKVTFGFLFAVSSLPRTKNQYTAHRTSITSVLAL